MDSIFFNAHHSPIGAFASFTCGHRGAKGGLGIELGKPADENLFIGAESATRPGVLEALPFFEAGADESKRYDLEKADAATPAGPVLIPYAAESITRQFGLGTDTWNAGDLTFRVLSLVHAIPDPATADPEELKAVLVPAVFAELTLDNSRGTRPRRVFFGWQGADPYSSMRRLDPTADGRFTGIGQGRRTAIACRDTGVESAQGFTLEDCVLPKIADNTVFGLGAVAALVGGVAAGHTRTFRFVICFHRGGIVTAGLDTSYLYTRFFPDIEDVADFALDNFDIYAAWAAEADAKLEQTTLSADQKFMLAHAVRSYYGSTELLDAGGEPFWVVNEGEYRMMNTFDLTADHVFFEMHMNPWVVRNALDMFVDRFSYRDQVRFPKNPKEFPGGISFTHDMGMANTISRPGYSTYELFGLDGCFSHMTHEQLVNWTLCGTTYVLQTKDRHWCKRRLRVFVDCLESLLHRDHPDPAQRRGVMGLDSSRTDGGAEITTYDSLDVSLGQARNNLYLAVKSWAAYVGLEAIFTAEKKPDLAADAARQAERCAATLVAHVTAGGYIPAVIAEGNDSKIIPAIEGLVFPWVCGLRSALDENGRYGALIRALRTHLESVLKPGVCLFPDGGWKMSSTSDNSWLSKTYLCQFVARQILGMRWDEAGARADAAHVHWLTRPESAYWSWSDQIVAGIAKGSKYYPRGVTAILWLEE